MELWFGASEKPSSPADPQEPLPYDRLDNLKNTFFDIFADHQIEPPALNYTDMVCNYMVPTGTGNQGKPGKMGRHFPVREKSGNFVKTGKEFCPKYWKNRKI